MIGGDSRGVYLSGVPLNELADHLTASQLVHLLCRLLNPEDHNQSMKTIPAASPFRTPGTASPRPEPFTAFPVTTQGQISRSVRRLGRWENDRQLQLAVVIDLDLISHGKTPRGHSATRTLMPPPPRVSDSDLSRALAEVFAACDESGVLRELHVACSPRTAFIHAMALMALPNNTLRIIPGLNGADSWLIERLDFIAQRHGSVDGVVLVGGDHAYAPPVGRLALEGIPTCVVSYSASLSADVRRVATDVVLL